MLIAPRRAKRCLPDMCGQWRPRPVCALAQTTGVGIARTLSRCIGSLAVHRVLSEDWLGCADAQAHMSLRWAHMQSYRHVCIRISINILGHLNTHVLTLEQVHFYYLLMCLKLAAGRVANSVGLIRRRVWSGSTLFAQACLSQYLP